MIKKKVEVSPYFNEYKEWLEALDANFDKEGELIYSGRNNVKKFNQGKVCLNVKSFKTPNMVNKFVYGHLRDSKAKRSYDYATRLLSYGVATPTPIGYVEIYKNGLFFKSYYISIQHVYDFTIREVLEYHVSNREAIMSQFIDYTFEKIHKNGVFHLDYSPGNILINMKEDGMFDFSLIDLNRMKFMEIDYKKGLYNLRQFDADKETLIQMGMLYARKWRKDPDEGARLLIEFDHAYKHKRVVKHRYKRFFKVLRFWK
ncbi:lipopolysaccharide kinase InaA family protein [Halosquirtibacter laminarini]|uniref:Lipopolysaccharide kinase InaA family protein n=1 Tax=Halosquirtibacter laminarini TaxID=3374600 RepID=A0AC61NGP6_9BACT|nr:lipopolysaccharide kinase InaA family protein [Prolixibacteraceae bacterium]